MKTVFDYNDIHKGETIYIFGSGPALNDLTDEDLEFLKDKPSIGVNLAYDGIKSIKYAISAHICNAVYLFEYANKDIPIFINYGDPRKVHAFSYLQQMWTSDRVVVFDSQPEKVSLTKKQGASDNALNGSSSILLLATHLAYIMGAGKIVYIGFEQVYKSHYWNFDPIMDQLIEGNIRKLLASKKYFSNIGYNESQHSLMSTHYNVHREFELLLGMGPLRPSVFRISDQEKKMQYHDGKTSIMVATELFTGYLRFLNNADIKTESLERRNYSGLPVSAGTDPISQLS